MQSDSDDSLIETRLEPFKTQKTRYWPHWQLWAAFVFALSAVLFNSAFQVLTEYAAKPVHFTVLPDISHSISDRYLSNWVPKSLIVDILLGLLLAITVARFLLFSSRKASMIILKRYLLLQGMIFLLRGPALYMTRLPPALSDPEECHFESSGSFIVDTILVVLRQKVTCTDLFFSGHSAMMLLWALFMTSYTRPDTFKSLRLYQMFMLTIWGLTICALTMILLTKFHYSIDVYIGIILPVLLKTSYDNIVAVLPYLNKASATLSWSQSCVCWFEAECPKSELLYRK